MMKQEFEQLANCKVTEFEYRMIEEVYNHYEFMFKDKHDIVLFYHTFGIDGVQRMSCERAGYEKVLESKRENLRSEERKYLNALVKSKVLHTFSLSVLSSLRDIVFTCTEKSEIDINDSIETLHSVVSFLNENIKKLESEDYSV